MEREAPHTYFFHFAVLPALLREKPWIRKQMHWLMNSTRGGKSCSESDSAAVSNCNTRPGQLPAAYCAGSAERHLERS